MKNYQKTIPASPNGGDTELLKLQKVTTEVTNGDTSELLKLV